LGDAQAIEGLQRELWDVDAEHRTHEGTILALSTAMTGLMEEASSSAPLGILHNDMDAHFKVHAKAVNSCLNLICQEMNGGSITVEGIMFFGQEATMDWAWIHLPPNTYQCIVGMVYAMCLILEFG
jgi:hypothetical protein